MMPSRPWTRLLWQLPPLRLGLSQAARLSNLTVVSIRERRASFGKDHDTHAHAHHTFMERNNPPFQSTSHLMNRSRWLVKENLLGPQVGASHQSHHGSTGQERPSERGQLVTFHLPKAHPSQSPGYCGGFLRLAQRTLRHTLGLQRSPQGAEPSRPLRHCLGRCPCQPCSFRK
ncbi:MAG: hypothetical protein JWM16_2678 [Verrucomicrobiales bacterium]|nr:hypothetical protein [Verrucomicrobiales bacterium]